MGKDLSASILEAIRNEAQKHELTFEHLKPIDDRDKTAKGIINISRRGGRPGAVTFYVFEDYAYVVIVEGIEVTDAEIRTEDGARKLVNDLGDPTIPAVVA